MTTKGSLENWPLDYDYVFTRPVNWDEGAMTKFDAQMLSKGHSRRNYTVVWEGRTETTAFKNGFQLMGEGEFSMTLARLPPITVIPLTDHPGNLAPTAVGVTGGLGPSIYKTQAGYIACLRDGMALAGYFPDHAEALEAQTKALAHK